MKAEIIAVGTEILLGQIVNTNAQYIAEGLADLGIDVYFQGVVGDNTTRVKEALQIASMRSDLVVCCGGLGPTEDDLTKDAIAEFTGAKLVIDEEAEAKILELFASKNESLITSNKRQANTIEGSHLLKNEVGLAVGFLYQHNDTYYAAIPGPPREMSYMFDHELKPLLDDILGERTKLYSKYLKFGGIGESSVEDTLKDLIANQSKVSLAPYAGIGEITVRLSVKANSEQEAEIYFAPMMRRINERLPKHLYSDQNESLEQAIGCHTISKFGVLEVNTTGYLTHQLLSSDDAHDNVKLSITKHLKQEITETLAKQQLLEFIKDNELNHGIAVFHCHDLPEASIASGRTTKTFYIGLCVDNQPLIIKREFIGDRQAVQIRAAKTAMYLFLKAFRTK